MEQPLKFVSENLSKSSNTAVIRCPYIGVEIETDKAVIIEGMLWPRIIKNNVKKSRESNKEVPRKRSKKVQYKVNKFHILSPFQQLAWQEQQQPSFTVSAMSWQDVPTNITTKAPLSVSSLLPSRKELNENKKQLLTGKKWLRMVSEQ